LTGRVTAEPRCIVESCETTINTGARIKVIDRGPLRHAAVKAQLVQLLAQSPASVPVEPRITVENGDITRVQAAPARVARGPLCPAAVKSQLVKLLALSGSAPAEPQIAIELGEIKRVQAAPGRVEGCPLGHAAIKSQLV